MISSSDCSLLVKLFIFLDRRIHIKHYIITITFTVFHCHRRRRIECLFSISLPGWTSLKRSIFHLDSRPGIGMMSLFTPENQSKNHSWE